MSKFGFLTASFSPARGITTLKLLSWPVRPWVGMRTDGRDEISLRVSKAHPAEEWSLVALRGGVLCPVAYLLDLKVFVYRVKRTDFNLIVCLPPHLWDTIEITTGSSVWRAGEWK